MDYTVGDTVTYVNASGSLDSGTVESLAVREGFMGAWIRDADDVLRWVAEDQIEPE